MWTRFKLESNNQAMKLAEEEGNTNKMCEGRHRRIQSTGKRK
jgi:hypothetical protein